MNKQVLGSVPGIGEKSMATVYLRKKRWWARIKDETGRWASVKTPFMEPDEIKALRYAKNYEATRRATGEVVAETGGAPGVACCAPASTDRSALF